MSPRENPQAAQAVEIELSEQALPGALAWVLSYWNDVRSGKFAPSLGEFDLVDLPPTCISQTIIVDLHAPDSYDSSRAKFRFFGTQWVRTSAQEVTGKTVDQFKPAAVQELLSEQYRSVVTSRQPHAYKNILPTTRGLTSTFYMLRLPLSSDGKSVDKVVSVSLFEQNRAGLQETFEKKLESDE